MAKPKTHSASFKAKVALEAIKGELTVERDFLAKAFGR